MIRKLAKQVQNIIKRGFITNLNDDSGDFPKVQTSYMGKVSDVETIWPYGMAAMPPLHSLVVIFNNQGQEEYKVAICSDPQFRFKGLQEGETCFGNNLQQTKIYFKKDGSVEIDAAPGANVTINSGANLIVNAVENVTINAQNLIVNGQIKATGDITDNYLTNSETMHGFREVYDIHTHNETGTVTEIPNQLV